MFFYFKDRKLSINRKNISINWNAIQLLFNLFEKYKPIKRNYKRDSINILQNKIKIDLHNN